MADIGERIKRARQLAKLSQRQLADAAGVGERSVGRIERGEAGKDPRVLSRLLDFLGLADDEEEDDETSFDVSRMSDGQLLAQRRLLEAEWERRYFAALDALREATDPTVAPRRGLPVSPPATPSRTEAARSKRLGSER